MERRDMLKGLAVLGSFGLAKSADAVEEDVKSVDVKKCVDDILRFESKASRHDFLTPSGLNLPFASQPINYYLRHNYHLKKEVAAPASLQPIVRRLRNLDKGVLPVLGAISSGLWEAWRPKDKEYTQVERLDQAIEFPYGYKKIRRDGALIGRTVTPKYTQDVAEMDPYTLAIALCSIKDITKEVKASVQRARETAKSDNQPFFMEYEPIAVEANLNAYLFEFFAHTLTAGKLLLQ